MMKTDYRVTKVGSAGFIVETPLGQISSTPNDLTTLANLIRFNLNGPTKFEFKISGSSRSMKFILSCFGLKLTKEGIRSIPVHDDGSFLMDVYPLSWQDEWEQAILDSEWKDAYGDSLEISTSVDEMDDGHRIKVIAFVVKDASTVYITQDELDSFISELKKMRSFIQLHNMLLEDNDVTS